MSGAQLSDGERTAIREAVAAVERASGAEIVPVLVESSDAYRLADWRGAVAGAAAGVAVELWASDVVGWSALAPWVPLAHFVAGALVGVVLARWPAVRRRLAGGAEIDERVAAGARQAFLANQVFRTRDRTGLLLYVSLFERRVEILADEGVYGAVPEPVWTEVAAEAASCMRRSSPGDALLAAIRRAGELVAEHGPRRRSDDRNELPDVPIEGG